MTTQPGEGTQAELTETQRRRGLMVMLVDTFLMWGGFFIVIPLISVHYVQDLGWDAALIGLVLGARQLVQQGMTLMGGALADKLGAKGLIAIGMLIRSLSFVMMGFATTFPLLLLSAVLAALGGALFDSPSSAAIAALTHPAERSRFYSINGVVGGLGMTIGPLIGAMLLHINFTFVAFVAAGFFLIAFFVALFLLPPVRVSTGTGGLMDGIKLALQDRRFVLFTAILMGYWFMWVQITISMPLIAATISGTNDAVSWVYALNSGMGIVLQYPVLRIAERSMSSFMTLILGVLIMALGLLSIAFVGHITGLLICVAIYAMGRLLASPSQQTVAAHLSNPAVLGSYFGVSSLALALGGSMGNVAGGLMYEYAQRIQFPMLPWLVSGGIGMLCVAGLLWMRQRYQGELNFEAV